MKVNKAVMVASMATTVFVSAFAAQPESSGGVWTNEVGEVETLSTAFNTSGLFVNGSLTLESGAVLTNSSALAYVSTTNASVGTLAINDGASFVHNGTAANKSTSAFAIGAAGSTGVVTVASGGSLEVKTCYMTLGRNGLTSSQTDRTWLSQGILNVFGTVTAPKLIVGEWFPQRNSSLYGSYVVDELPVAGIVNLEEGGVLAIAYLSAYDTARLQFNFKGGTLRATGDSSDFSQAGGSAQQWIIADGKNLVFDTQSYNVRIMGASIQDDFMAISGTGGLVKRGSGYLQFTVPAAQNTFSGNIVVEEGTLSIGRPLLEGQTVTVKSGAKFYPVCESDLAKITYENAEEKPTGALFTINTILRNDVDLTSMTPDYLDTALGGTVWTWESHLKGRVTPADGISMSNPFKLVGQKAGTTTYLSGTGLGDYPLEVSGTGTFQSNDWQTNKTDNAISIISSSATFIQNGETVVTAAEGADSIPTLTISGPGAFKAYGAIRLGFGGTDGAMVVQSNVTVTTTTHVFVGGNATAGSDGTLLLDNATMTVGGNIWLGGNSAATTRALCGGTVVMSNSTLNVSGAVHFSANEIADGSDYDTVYNQIILGPGAVLGVKDRIYRNDDPRARVTFAGGKVKLNASPSSGLSYNDQNGTLEYVTEDGSDFLFDLGAYSTTFASLRTHIFGSGDFRVFGNSTSSVMTLGSASTSDFTLSYTGDTVVSNATLKIAKNNMLPSGSSNGNLVLLNGVLNLNGFTQTVNSVSGTGSITGSGYLIIGADDSDSELPSTIEIASSVKVIKVGSGKLTINTIIDNALQIQAGTAVVRGSPAYTTYRFKVDATSNLKGNTCMQISELKFYNGSTEVTRPYASVTNDTTKSSTGNIYSSDEPPAKALDGDTGTKWCDTRMNWSTSTAEDIEKIWVSVTYSSPRPITGYSWYTANDTYKNPGRNPTAWRLQGSNDGGTTWTDIDTVTGYTATTANNALGFETASLGTFGEGASVVVADGAVLQVDGGVLRVNNGGRQLVSAATEGSVQLLNGARLIGTANGILRGGTTGTEGIDITGDFAIAGAQAYEGVTHVKSGTTTLGVAANTNELTSFGGKYFRLTIKRSNNNGVAISMKNGKNTVNDNGGMQASEFQLYDADGNNVANGLTQAADGTAAASLSAGYFAAAEAYTYGTNEGAEKLFDGSTSTKCNMTVPIDRDAPSTWRVFTMRLADSAAPVVSYNFYTANDYNRRSPTDWLLEGSEDGVEWVTLDERFFAPNAPWSIASGNTTYNDSNLQYKPFNNGTPFRFQETMHQPATSGKYFRFTFKKTCGNTILQLSELQLLDAEGNNIAVGLTKATDGTAATSLVAGTFATAATYSYGDNEGSDKLFDDNPDTKMCAIKTNLNGTQSNYRIFTIRLPDDAAPVCGYNFVTANDVLARTPSDWLVEGSADGETWTTLDERSGEAAPVSNYASSHHGRPYVFANISESGSISTSSALQVDSGATFNVVDEDATIGALRYDASLGGGTIVNFRPAANGTLEIVNYTGANIYAETLFAIEGTSSNLENLKRWTVTVNGKSVGAKLTVREGKLVLVNGGTLILFR